MDDGEGSARSSPGAHRSLFTHCTSGQRRESLEVKDIPQKYSIINSCLFLFFYKVEDCFDVFPLARSAQCGTRWNKKSTVWRLQRGQVGGFKSSRSGWRVAESSGSAVGALETRRLPDQNDKREERADPQNLDGYGGCEDVRPARWSCFSFAVREERPRRDYKQKR